jgi:RNA polymerase sigma-32 factor
MTYPCTANVVESESTITDGSRRSEGYNPLATYLHEISKYPLMTKEEERETALRVLTGDKGAVHKMVVANLRLVAKLALSFHNPCSLLDLIQEGNMGFVRAVKKYDPEKGTRSATYATFWIRAYMLKFQMDTWSLVRIGTKDSQRKLFYRLKRKKEMLERCRIFQSSEALAGDFGVSTAELEDMEFRLSHGDVSLEEPQY